MANIPSTVDSWSPTAGSNQPDSSDFLNLRADLQALQGAIRKDLAHYGTSLASATATSLSSAEGNFVDVTGTASITSFGTMSAGMWKVIKFTGIATLTHNGTSLYLPGAADITTAAGDTAFAYSLGSGNWKVAFYQRAASLASGDASTNTSISEDSEIALFSSTGGKTLKRASNTGMLKASSGVLATATAGVDYAGVGAVTATACGLTMATGKLLGRTTASSGAIEEITVGTGLSLSAGSLTATGGGITLGTMQATTSGTAIDFTSIPATAKEIYVLLSGVSVDAASIPIIQLGDSGGIETSGYSAGAQVVSSDVLSTVGFPLTGAAAIADTYHGVLRLMLMDSATNLWAGGLSGTRTNVAGGITGGGTKALSGTLDRIRLTSVSGTANFDAGSINIAWR